MAVSSSRLALTGKSLNAKFTAPVPKMSNGATRGKTINAKSMVADSRESVKALTKTISITKLGVPINKPRIKTKMAFAGSCHIKPIKPLAIINGNKKAIQKEIHLHIIQVNKSF